MAGFKITGSKGFHITFENGVTVSVQFGPGTYSGNYDMSFHVPLPNPLESDTAEVALWRYGGNWITQEFKPEDGNDVLNQQTPAGVLEALKWAEQYKP